MSRFAVLCVCAVFHREEKGGLVVFTALFMYCGSLS